MHDCKAWLLFSEQSTPLPMNSQASSRGAEPGIGAEVIMPHSHPNCVREQSCQWSVARDQ